MLILSRNSLNEWVLYFYRKILVCVPREAKIGHWIPRARVTGVWELLDVGAGNWTLFLLKSNASLIAEWSLQSLNNPFYTRTWNIALSLLYLWQALKKHVLALQVILSPLVTLNQMTVETFAFYFKHDYIINFHNHFFLRQGFSIALKPVLEEALVDQVGLEHTEICFPLFPKSWD